MSFPIFLGHAPLGAAAYSDKVLATASANLIAYWPLWEASGATADNLEGTAARDGTYTGVTLGQTGIGDGRTCPSFDGSGDFVNVYSASLATAWNGAELSIAGWFKVVASTWTDSTYRNLWQFRYDVANDIYLEKSDVVGGIYLRRAGGGTIELLNYATGSPTTWMHFCATVSETNDRCRLYLNGGTPVASTGLGAWTGLPDTDWCNFGRYDSWVGLAAHVAVWTTELTAAQITNLATV